MSMISAQVDELRELATRCDELQVGAVKAVTMPSDMGSILRDAADTICELRGALQVASVDYRQLSDENAKLRELMYERAHVYAIQHMTEAELRIVATNVMEDNAKLRELVCHLYEYRQLYFKTGIYPTDHGVTEQRMRELGVEVDE